jgi:hypothetical protein
VLEAKPMIYLVRKPQDNACFNHNEAVQLAANQNDLRWQPHPQYGIAEAQEGEPRENARDNKI